MTVKIVIVGTGAVGAVYGSLFSKVPNHEVYTICRSNYQQVKEKGFDIESAVYGTYNFIPTGVFSSINEAGDLKIQFDYVVVTMKNIPGCGDIPQLIKPLISKKSSIIIIQNGIEIEKPFKDLFKDTPLVSCVAIIAASQVESGKIVHKEATKLSIGLYPKPEPESESQSQELQGFEFILKESKVPYDVVPDIVCSRWFKLEWNCSFSPISILSGCCNTFQMQHEPDVEDLIRDTMFEIRSLSEAVMGHPMPSWVPYPDIDKYLSLTHNIHYKPSLMLDYERKNPLELETTLGNLIRAARRINHPVPRVSTFYALLKLSDKKNRNLLDSETEPEKS